MKKSILDAINEALSQPPVSGELADFVQFLHDEYSIKVPERVINEWKSIIQPITANGLGLGAAISI